ncbi:MAG: rod shape-determining protein MreC [Actinomycetota bacterium]
MYNRKRRNRLLLGLLLVASITVVTLDFRQGQGGPIAHLRRAAVAVFGPLEEGVSRIVHPVGDFLSGLGQVGTLRGENSRLKREVAELKDRVNTYDDLARENGELRRLVGMRDERCRCKTVAATRVGTAPSNYSWAITINVGTADGVGPDMAVINQDGLVGKVVEANANYAVVKLIVDPGSGATARVARSAAIGRLSGRGPSSLSFELLDPEAEVIVGDAVVTAAIEKGIFPEGIPVGTVTEVFRERNALTKRVRVTPYVDFSSIDKVLVVTAKATGPPEG